MIKRSEVEERFKWDLTKFVKNEEDFLNRLKKLENKTTKISKFENKLSSDEKLLDCLQFEDEMGKEFECLGVYCFCLVSENVTKTKSNELSERLDKISSEYCTLSSFVNVEISEFSNEKLEKLSKDTNFLVYKRYFENIIKNKKHVLSKKEEKLLSGMNFLGGFRENFDKFNDGDLKFNKVMDKNGDLRELNHSNFITMLESKDEVLRKNAFLEKHSAYGRFANFISSNYINKVKSNCYFSKVRGFKSSLEKAIFYEEASEDVYNLLIKKVNENLGIIHNYMEIKRKMLKMNKITIADTFAPVCQDIKKEYSYDQAIEIIKEACNPLGDEYVSLIQRAKDERWIDVMPNEGKDSGAYSISAFGITPMVSMNFKGNLESVFTLAHELGHAIHSYYSMKNQPYQTSDYVIFVAEVASTTNEMLLLNYMLDKASEKNEKLYLFDKLLNQVKGTIFRQTMFSEFEEFSHKSYEKGRPLTKELLNNEYLKLNKKHFGENVEVFDETKFEWMRIPHFYRPFYVYKYATGLISAINFSQLFKNKKQDMKNNYLNNFLSAGSSFGPIKILQNSGCNLEKESSFDNVFNYLKDIVKQWKELS